MNVGKFIKNHRKKLNMTQKELAETLNVCHITVCRWETNFIAPSNHHWIILQNLFGARNDNLVVPLGETVKKIEPLQKLNKKDERDKQIADNYKKGTSLESLASLYNLKQNTVRCILLSQKIKIPKKTKKDRTCKICNKTFKGRNNKTCSVKCLKTLRKQNIKNKYKAEKNHVCYTCGKKFTGYRVGIKTYCSKPCKNTKIKWNLK